MRSSGSTSSTTTSPPVAAREPDEARDLDVVRADPVLASAELVDACDVEDVRADALDLRAERDEEAAEILDVRLAGRVPEHGLALGEDGGHDRVLRPHDGRLVEVHARAAQPVGGELVRAVRARRRRRAPGTRGRACRAGGGR